MCLAGRAHRRPRCVTAFVDRGPKPMRIPPAELRARASRLLDRLAACDLCPRRCGVNRLAGETGACGVGRKIALAASVPHFGEEPPISGDRGAGTLFLGGCNLRCVYCQNHQISRLELPVARLGAEELSTEILRLQERGCHNIEFVTPSHVVPQILEALALAVERGLDLPVIYNTGGYDSRDVLAALDGVVDLYLPDFKYADAKAAAELSGAPDYWEVTCQAIREMVRQCGALELDEHGIARRGVIVRHLVLPCDLAGSGRVLVFLAGLDPRPAISLMAQFYPPPGSHHPALQRPLLPDEYERVRQMLTQLGLDKGWVQELVAKSNYRPDFSQPDPFRVPHG